MIDVFLSPSFIESFFILIVMTYILFFPVEGYHKNVGGGIMRVQRINIDEAFLNDTSDEYDCVKRVNYGIIVIMLLFVSLISQECYL